MDPSSRASCNGGSLAERSFGRERSLSWPTSLRLGCSANRNNCGLQGYVEYNTTNAARRGEGNSVSRHLTKSKPKEKRYGITQGSPTLEQVPAAM
eukprot:IDg7663t1